MLYVNLFYWSLLLSLISPKDIMFFKVIAVTLITLCAADNRMLLTELESDQELPALRFNGHVFFPKIYKYAKVDQYRTLSSILRPVRSVSPNLFRKLQYAPLHDGVSQKNKNADAEYDSTPTLTSVPSDPTELLPDKKTTQLFTKSHLEPRPVARDTKCYAKGHKFETVASVSRSPGHNAVYRIIPEQIEIEKPVKISNYAKPIGINLKLESLTTTIKPLLDLASKHVNEPLTLTNEDFVINPDGVETEEPSQDKSKRYLPHAKYHRLHLNIARVYSPGQVPPKPAIFPSVYPENYGRGPPHPQVYVPQSYPDLNTMLYPVNRHRKGYRFRTSIIHL